MQGPAVKAGSGLKGGTPVVLVGCGRGGWGSGVCARAPSLILVRDPGLSRVGDMMVDGVIPLGEALRPLGL